MEVEWIESHSKNVYRAGYKGKVIAIHITCIIYYHDT